MPKTKVEIWYWVEQNQVLLVKQFADGRCSLSAGGVDYAMVRRAFVEQFLERVGVL